MVGLEIVLGLTCSAPPRYETWSPRWPIARGGDLTVYQHAHEGLHLAIVAEVDDAYHPNQKVTLDIHSALPPFADEDSPPGLDELASPTHRVSRKP